MKHTNTASNVVRRMSGLCCPSPYEWYILQYHSSRLNGKHCAIWCRVQNACSYRWFLSYPRHMLSFIADTSYTITTVTSNWALISKLNIFWIFCNGQITIWNEYSLQQLKHLCFHKLLDTKIGFWSRKVSHKVYRVKSAIHFKYH